MGQLLQQDAVADRYFQHRAAQAADARLVGEGGSSSLSPGLLQAKATLLATPAAGREQAAENLTQELRPFAGGVGSPWLVALRHALPLNRAWRLTTHDNGMIKYE
jgi:hypothetical protein